jgi:transglutaminase-like putative cysteine protease
MNKTSFLIISAVLTFLIPGYTKGQFTMDFGNIFMSDLSNKPCKFDPGAGAEVLSDAGIATLNYVGKFYVEFERDVKIRIINSKGFDYGNVEIPYSSDNTIVDYRASVFNLQNGKIAETKIPKKSFLKEINSRTKSYLRFSFPDVHEGTIIEYSYIERLDNEALMTLVPWEFQREIPIVKTSVTVVYPGFFDYKWNISGNPAIVGSQLATKEQYIAGQQTKTHINTWFSKEVPAFITEPFIKSLRENQTRVSFELGSFNFPGSSYEEITPTYSSLAGKLGYRDDFGQAITSALFLRSFAISVTKGLNDDLEKLKAIRKFVSEKVFWNGDKDFASTSTLRNAWNNAKGNSADINMILVVMLRYAGLNADPVILSTRSNGTINQYFAMLSQFNYLVADVTINGKSYFVDATDPLSPFDLLPFDCLNGTGRLISGDNSWFVEVKNSEKYSSSRRVDLNLDGSGSVAGTLEIRNSGYSAHSIRQDVKLRGEEGFSDIINETNPEIELTNVKIKYISLPDSDIIETATLNIEEGCQVNEGIMMFNPYFSFRIKNPFVSLERKFPVDFGCPRAEIFDESIILPDNLTVMSLPEQESIVLGSGDAEYSFSCEKSGNKLILKSLLKVNRITYPPSDYNSIREFYTKIARSQSRLIFLNKNS